VLSLDRQNRYRERYRALHPGWRTSGDIYEFFARRIVTPAAAGALHILDAGGGSGGVVELFSQRLRLAVAVDLDLPSLLQHRATATQRAAADLACLPFQDGFFDLVLCSWVLEHLVEPEQVFVEISRVLKAGGRFIFITPNSRNPITFLNRVVPRLLQNRVVSFLYGRGDKDTFPVTYQANTVERIDRLATAAGLRAVQVELVSDPSYLAFNDLLFSGAMLLEAALPEERFVHIVGDYVKH
jgi:ubiquinone/menaquinone biosynthesis C-methylase UbiE